MREIVVKLNLDDSGWGKDDHDTLVDVLRDFLFEEIGSAREVQILSDSNDGAEINVNAMMQLA
jgi:hypothetical protein